MTNSQKGSSTTIILTAVVVVLLVIIGVFVYNARFNQQPIVENPNSQPKPTLALDTVTPNPISAGSTLLITGRGFASEPSAEKINSDGWTKHSHMTIYIKNLSTDRSALLWEGNPTIENDKTLPITFPEKACIYSIRESGDSTCQTFRDLKPGNYNLIAYIDYLGLSSNPVELTVK